jgi:pimeloyl-ACP methyl ester carboxylesterase
MPYFTRAGIRIHFKQRGRGVPVVLQHGLGADSTQPFALFRQPAGYRLLAFDCRAHGRTPAGPQKDIGLAVFADDLAALLDAARVERAVIGGISMGAAVALNFVLRYPEKAVALVLSRPAWLDAPNPWNVRVFSLMTRLLRQHGVQEGRRRFVRSKVFQQTQTQWPDVAASLVSQFDRPGVEQTAFKFERIIRDAPCTDRSGWSSIAVPTLVLANRRDPIHPFA